MTDRCACCGQPTDPDPVAHWLGYVLATLLGAGIAAIMVLLLARVVMAMWP